MRWNHFLINLQAYNLIKKRFQHNCFLVNIAKLLTIPFSQNTTGRLLLYSYELDAPQ